MWSVPLIAVYCDVTCPRFDQPCSDLTRHNLYRRGPSTCPNHRLEVRAAMVLRLVSIVDAFLYSLISRSIDSLKADLFRHTRGDDPPSLLPHCSMKPARA